MLLNNDKTAMIRVSETSQVIICALIIAATAVWLPFYQAEVGSLLDQYDFAQTLVWQEPWRLISAHVFHLDISHAGYNAAGLLIVTLFFARHFTVRSWLNAILVITVLTSVGVWLIGIPARFVGLSGLIHGLLVLSLLLEWAQHNYARTDWLSPTVLVLLVLKVCLEIIGLLESQVLLSQGAQFGYVHAAGVLAGVIAWRLHRRRLASLANAISPPATTAKNDSER